MKNEELRRIGIRYCDAISLKLNILLTLKSNERLDSSKKVCYIRLSLSLVGFNDAFNTIRLCYISIQIGNIKDKLGLEVRACFFGL